MTQNPYEPSKIPATPKEPASPGDDLSQTGRNIILAAAFLGWMFSGFQMALMTLSARAATTEFIRTGQVSASQPLDLQRLLAPLCLPTDSPPAISGEKEIMKQIGGPWFSWYQAAFLLGAAGGGLVFGWLGDHLGRVRAMGASIFCFSIFSGLGYFVASPEQLLLLRVLSGMGVGGMWPTGVSLASEAWSDASRPMISGLLGTSANVGLVALNVLGYFFHVVPDSWRWTQLVCGAPVFLAILVWAMVPESRRWLATRNQPHLAKQGASMATVFRPPLLRLTLIGIAVGTIPLLGGWGATQWFIPWADKVGGAADPSAKALAGIMRSGGACIGGLIGGWLASLAGRRLTYFLVSLASFGLGEFIYRMLTPSDAAFWPFVFVLGLVSTIYFGWLPLYLPELFPTHARATGAGVSFNFGRILTAVGVLGAGAITAAFNDDYARAGSITTLIYAVGMIVILFAPDTTKKRLED
ncbi:MAG TPA: MFS transporter [Pirellulaceae bacterium]|nr:MFS transporter [Pirellulaceae bacterium]